MKENNAGHGLSLNTIYNMDCIEGMKLIPDNSIDSIVTDPPYEIGFMGKGWDSTGIANNVDMWRECLRVLKPGGHLLSFAATRTYHRMAVAIEDAGFEVRDMIEWVYGSGFPKSLNIGKAVDKIQGNERSEYIDEDFIKRNPKDNTDGVFESGLKDGIDGAIRTKGTSEWEGWGTALKPAHEPICMARKPLTEKTVAENCLKWGTGGINIDGSRVGTDNIKINNTELNTRFANFNTQDTIGQGYISKESIGRFPANLIHDNSEEVRECFPDSKSPAKRQTNSWYPTGEANGVDGEAEGYGDSGNASRFFKSILYYPKASKSERCNGNNHPTVKPIALMEYLIKMVTKEGGIVLDPFMGSGTTAIACLNTNRNFIGFELDEGYWNIANKRIQDRLSENTLF